MYRIFKFLTNMKVSYAYCTSLHGSAILFCTLFTYLLIRRGPEIVSRETACNSLIQSQVSDSTTIVVRFFKNWRHYSRKKIYEESSQLNTSLVFNFENAILFVIEDDVMALKEIDVNVYCLYPILWHTFLNSSFTKYTNFEIAIWCSQVVLQRISIKKLFMIQEIITPTINSVS